MERSCPKCKSGYITGFSCNDHAIMWCGNCRCYLEAKKDEIEELWKAKKGIRQENGRPLVTK